MNGNLPVPTENVGTPLLCQEGNKTVHDHFCFIVPLSKGDATVLSSQGVSS